MSALLINSLPNTYELEKSVFLAQALLNFNENKTFTLQLVFLLMLFREA